jgi:hypothetical protein
MSGAFFKQIEIPVPVLNLGVGFGTLGRQSGHRWGRGREVWFGALKCETDETAVGYLGAHGIQALGKCVAVIEKGKE